MRVLVTLLSMLVYTSGISQAFNYELTIDEAAFVPFQDGEVLFDQVAWAGFDSVAIPLNFSVQIGDNKYTKLYFECSGRFIFGNDHLNFVDVLTMSDLNDQQTMDPSLNSEVTYRIQATSNTNVLEIQVLNALINNGQDTISYQLKLSETGVFTYTVGDNSLLRTNRSITHYTGLYSLVGFSPWAIEEGVSFYGNHDEFNDTVYTGNVNPFFHWWMTGKPEKGTRFSLTPVSSSLSNEPDIAYSLNKSIYYSNGLLKATEALEVDVFDVAGRLVYSGTLDPDGQALNSKGLVIVVTPEKRVKCIAK